MTRSSVNRNVRRPDAPEEAFGNFVRDVFRSRLALGALWIISIYGTFVLARGFDVGGVILALDDRAAALERRALSDAADPRKPDEMLFQTQMGTAGRIRGEASAIKAWLRK